MNVSRLLSFFAIPPGADWTGALDKMSGLAQRDDALTFSMHQAAVPAENRQGQVGSRRNELGMRRGN